MRAFLKTTDPDAVEFTLTVTMNLKGWRELQEALRGNPTWVGTQLSLQITDMVFRADKHFWPTNDEAQS